ncbi:MAG: hypothetical protein ACK5Z5_00345 [Neisseriaceae bacterium]
MRVLITNYFIKSFTGSEINCYELSRYFVDHGHTVEVFCFDKNLVFIKYFKNIDVRVIDRIDDLSVTDYDLIWSQHYPVLNFLLLNKIKSDKIIFSSLSPFESFEFPPPYANKLSLVLANSHETKDQLIKNRVHESNTHVFPNSIDFNYFVNPNNSPKNITIKKIICVSNHYPTEILSIKNMLEKSGISVDYFGAEQEKFELITPEILGQYDCVITIGKTVQYAMSLKIPVYCYDYFGGPGWITRENLELAFKNNFSGRGFGYKSAELIVDELLGLYKINLNNLDYLYDFCYKNCNLDKNIMITLERANQISAICEDELVVDTILYKRVYDLYISCMNSYSMQKVQLFYDMGNGFSEELSITQDFDLSKEVYKFDLSMVKEKIRSIRFDPINSPAKIKFMRAYAITQDTIIHDLKIKYDNSTYHDNDWHYFYHHDPILFMDDIEIIDKIIEVSFILKIETLNVNQVYKYIEQINQVMNEKNNIILQISRTLTNRDLEIEQYKVGLQQKDLEIEQNKTSLLQKDLKLQQKTQEMQQRDQELQQKAQELQQRDQELQQQIQELQQRDLELQQNYQYLQEVQQKDWELLQKYQYLDSILQSKCYKILSFFKIVRGK